MIKQAKIEFPEELKHVKCIWATNDIKIINTGYSYGNEETEIISLKDVIK
jgi:hypothetical protein